MSTTDLLDRARRHRPVHALHAHAHAAVHGTSAWGRFNQRVAVAITRAVGTMTAAYIFAALALVALPSALALGPYYIVVWLSSTFIQLVFLPLLAVGQQVSAAHEAERAAADHETLTLLHAMNTTQLEILQALQARGDTALTTTPTDRKA